MNIAAIRKSALVRKVAVAIAGFSVLAAGLALIVLPGPAIVVLPLGLAILSKEFPWARSLLNWLKNTLRRIWLRTTRIFRRPVSVVTPS